MSGQKKLWIAAAVAVTAALIIAVVHNGMQREIPEHTPGTLEVQEHAQPDAEETEKEVIVSEDLILSVVQDGLGSQLDVSELKVAFEENNVITLTGEVSKASIQTMLDAQEDSISSAYQSMLFLLPDALPFEITIQLSVEQGAVTMRPTKVTVSSMELSDDMLGTDWIASFEQGLNSELSKQLKTISGMQSGSDGIIVSGT